MHMNKAPAYPSNKTTTEAQGVLLLLFVIGQGCLAYQGHACLAYTQGSPWKGDRQLGQLGLGPVSDWQS